MKRRLWLVLMCGLVAGEVLAASLPAQPVAAQKPPEGRPRIGLVLGGGGARGAAHIGVLEVMEKLRVPVDCIGGTSMGGLVAGAFAAGLSPAEMRTALAKADWTDMFQDNPAYSEINYRNKAISRRFLPGSETGVTATKGLEYQAGVVSGQKIKLFFNQLVNADQGERNIETLPIPLSIVATDIGNGEKVVFRDGSLTKAMRASMSVPGLMAPVDHQGRKLVDGGLVDNVPIAEVRNRCNADVVIAVNVGSPLLKPEEVGSMLSISVQMVALLTEQNVTQSLTMLKPGDIYIKPDLEGITAGDFQRSSETADRGVKAADALSTRLSSLSVSEATYAAWNQKVLYARTSNPRVDEVQIAEMKRVNPVAVDRHLRVKPGDTMNGAELNKDLMHVYGDGWYESVDYSLLTARDRNILRVTPIEKAWGPDYLRLGFNLYTNFNNESDYTLRAGYDKTWLNDLGGQLLMTGEIGKRHSLSVDYYQPLEATQTYFFETSLYAGKNRANVYQRNEKVAEYSQTSGLASVSLGMNVGLLGQVRTGWRYNKVKSDLDTGVAVGGIPASSDHSYSGAFVGLDFDQMDRLYFPTSGWASRLLYTDVSGKDYSKLVADLRGAQAFGDYVLNARLNYQGSPQGKLPFYDAGTLGGINNFSSFAQNQLNGDDIKYGSVRMEKIIGSMPLGLRGDLRLGVALERAKVGTPYTETTRTGWMNSASIYFGSETPLGPVYLGYGRSDEGVSNVYMSIGIP